MKNVTTINGFYGSNNTPCEVFIYENRNGSKWYCVEGSQMVNKTHDEIPEGTNVEELNDHDCLLIQHILIILMNLFPLLKINNQ